MSLVSLSDAQDRAGDSVTQDQIDEAEEDLERMIGPLVGERSETFLFSERAHPWRAVDGLYLQRYTDSVSLTHDGDALTEGTDFRLLAHSLVERVHDSATGWSQDMVATYEPNDEEIVRSVIFDLLTYRQTPAGLQSIRIGAYSETFFPSATSANNADVVVGAMLRKILPAAGMGLTSPFRLASIRRDRTLVSEPIVGSGS
jgi:hypothetical protein